MTEKLKPHNQALYAEELKIIKERAEHKSKICIKKVNNSYIFTSW